MADDFNVSNLYESKNEWASRLVNIFTPLVIEGFTSIIDESYKLCVDNDEEEKYLMTFQNMISNIPGWSSATVQEEKERIIRSSGCDYLNDLITCVHVIQLKILTCVRVGQKQKPIEIDIPSLDSFVHKVYINVARRLYSNVYLFEKNILPLQIQKHNRELEIIVKECILNTVRDSIPVEEILKAYLSETTEEEIEEIKEVIQENVETNEKTDVKTSTSSQELKVESKEPENTSNSVIPQIKDNVTQFPSVISNSETQNNVDSNTNDSQKSLRFSDTDEALSSNNMKEIINAPKDIDTLEKISNERKNMDDDDDDDKLTIYDNGNISLDVLDINDVNKSSSSSNDILIPDIEVL